MICTGQYSPHRGPLDEIRTADNHSLDSVRTSRAQIRRFSYAVVHVVRCKLASAISKALTILYMLNTMPELDDLWRVMLNPSVNEAD